MSEELIHVFADCTEAIEQGRLSVGECLEQYPQYRDELSDLLQMTDRLRSVPAATPSADFLQAAPARLLSQLPTRATFADDGVSAAPADSKTAVPQTAIRRLHRAQQTLVQKWPFRWQPSLGFGMAFLLIAILFFGFWLRPESEVDNEIAHNPSLAVTTPTTSGIAAAETSNASPTPHAAATTTAVTAPDNTTFIPLISNPLQLNAQTAAVEVSNGIVEVQNSDGTWTAVNQIAAAAAGQRVRTGAFSSANITFHDGSQVSLGANSEISIDELNAQLPGNGFRTIVLTQWHGNSEHQVDHRNDNGSLYEVKTPNGSGVARGTTFQVSVDRNRLTHYIVIDGQVDVTHLNVTVGVIAGQITLIKPDEPPSEPFFTVTGQGEVTAVGNTWIIGGQTFATTNSTITIGNPQIGDIVSVSGYLLPDGSLVAAQISLLHRSQQNPFTIIGEVESIDDTEWIVAGQVITVNAETKIDDQISIGDTVRLHGLIVEDNILLAHTINLVNEENPFEFVGIVQERSNTSWLISDVSTTVDEATKIEAGIKVGDIVRVEGVILPDGIWLAQEIQLEEEAADFEFTGIVDSLDPWIVAGISFSVDDFTEIDDDIEIGRLVHVEGQILADGTWLAAEIVLVEDPDELTNQFVGRVERIDPWVVNGLSLLINEATEIDDGIEVGDLVRVTAVILPDNSLLAAEIELLDDGDATIGCFTLSAIIIGINGNQLILEDMAPITLDDDVLIEGQLDTNSVIIITACVSQDGTVNIINIIVIYVIQPPPPPSPPGNDDDDNNSGDRVTLCHKGRNTLTLPQSALSGHLGHGDTLGPCN